MLEINNCITGICQNGGTCQDLVGDYVCSCVPGYTGRNCQTSESNNKSNNIQHCASYIGCVRFSFPRRPRSAHSDEPLTRDNRTDTLALSGDFMHLGGSLKCPFHIIYNIVLHTQGAFALASRVDPAVLIQMSPWQEIIERTHSPSQVTSCTLGGMP